jgi:hypothetical protein
LTKGDSAELATIAARIANPRQVFYAINKHVKDMLRFTTSNCSRLCPLEAADITFRELQLAIPANTSPMIMQEILEAISKSALENPSVSIKIIKVAD